MFWINQSNNETRCVCDPAILSIDYFAISRLNNSLCSSTSQFSNQYVGLYGLSKEDYSAVVYKNMEMRPKPTSCEDAVMMSSFPPESSRVIELWIPDSPSIKVILFASLVPIMTWTLSNTAKQECSEYLVFFGN